MILQNQRERRPLPLRLFFRSRGETQNHESPADAPHTTDRQPNRPSQANSHTCTGRHVGCSSSSPPAFFPYSAVDWHISSARQFGCWEFFWLCCALAALREQELATIKVRAPAWKGGSTSSCCRRRGCTSNNGVQCSRFSSLECWLTDGQYITVTVTTTFMHA